jgi:septum formation protein
MLADAGVAHEAISPTVDEGAIKQGLSDPAEIAAALASEKALSAAAVDWTIGSDSVVSVQGKLFDKPESRDQAADHLRGFSGRAMQLVSAVALARSGNVDWLHVGSATLHVRSLSEAFIQSYLDAEWPEVGYCVGVFRMEGRGVQLFDRVEGDHFTILGMPLIPLLGALRERGMLAS